MKKHARDIDAEHLFAGDGVASDDPLTRFAADVRTTFTAPPDERSRALHMSAVRETYEALIAGATGEQAPVRTRRRRRYVIRGAVAAAGLVLVGGTAMAATGTLPDVAQDAVARVAKVFGVKLPPAHEAEVPVLRTDLDHPDLEMKSADQRETQPVDDDDDDGVRGADTRADDDEETSGRLTRTKRRPRREADDRTDGGTSPSTGGSIDSGDDGTPIVDDRGDPSGDTGTGDDGSEDTDPDRDLPGDGGSTDEPDGGGDGGGGRGDPTDGTASDAPSGAEAPSGADIQADPDLPSGTDAPSVPD